jgi:hypothetical protein
VTETVLSQPPKKPRRSFPARIVGALLLDGTVYEEIEEDASSMAGAIGVVAVAGLARGVATPSPTPTLEIVGSALAGLTMWLVAGLLSWGIGVKRMGYTSSYPELLRTLGYAAAPLVLLLIGLMPLGPAWPFAWTVAHGWALLALVVALREALDVSSSTATVVCLLSLATAVAVVAGLSTVLLLARPVS